VTLQFLGDVNDDLVPTLTVALAAVREATRAVLSEPAPGPSSFAGHLTLARVKGRDLDRSTRAALAGIPCAAEFDVARFDLVASELSPDGPRYTGVAQFALPG